MNKKHKPFIFSIPLVIGILVIGYSVGFAWTNPTAAPFGGNPPPPVQLQGATPGTVQTGNINISGTGLFGGNVGIGTTAPGAPLVVFGGEGTYVAPTFGSANRGAIHIRSLTSDRRNAITFSPAGIDSAQAGIYVHQDNAAGTHMFLATTDSYAIGPQARITISNAGNVGIGTTAPAERLDVAGNLRVSGFINFQQRNCYEVHVAVGGGFRMCNVGDYTAGIRFVNSSWIGMVCCR